MCINKVILLFHKRIGTIIYKVLLTVLRKFSSIDIKSIADRYTAAHME